MHQGPFSRTPTRTRPARHKTLGFAVLVSVAFLLAASAPAAEPFPSQGILPKDETGAARFREQFPDYDGRGIVVAILDTGVDPGAPGLQYTPDGRPKIVDVVDATGSGDVDMSTVRTAADGLLEGLSGRRLKVPADWSNPTGEFRLGLKRADELFPRALTQRLRRQRRELWDEQQRPLEIRLRRELADWEAAHPNPSPAETKAREERAARLELWREFQDSFEDPGPIFDCVVFHDGHVWRAVVDTDEDGDLANEKALANFRIERQFGTFGAESQLNFAVNIHDHGRRLSIVVDSGMHGTHVAGIVAAHFPGQPELDGIAPGAQIVSVKIGDTRLDSMETSTGFERGLAVVRELQCDVINLSYGEPTTLPNRGRLIELIAGRVDEDGIVFVASAGNSGPALSTVGAPGGTTSSLIGVGAYVSPAMMATGYSMRQQSDETLYTFSSRGPTYDGDLGVDLSAPGGAIAPVPNWTLQRGQLANGTSMAAPSVAGAVALLLSGLKAEGVPTSPIAIRRALEHTARPVPGLSTFDQGRGLIQVDRAFPVAKALAQPFATTPRHDVSLPDRQAARGVHLRESHEATRPLVTTVRVRPVFPKSTPHPHRVHFEGRFRLESSAPWIEAPSHLVLYHGGRTFEVRVDPTSLPPGAHYGEIQALEVPDRGAGPAFRIPVTVIRPHALAATDGPAWSETLELSPAHLERRFFSVPHEATRAELHVRAGAMEASRRLVVHALQLVPGRPYTETGTQRYLTLEPRGEELLRFPVTGGRTLELCLGQVWSSLGEGAFEFSLQFRGVVPAESTVTLGSGDRARRIEVAAPIADARIAPAARLVGRRRWIHPSASRLTPLAEDRDTLPGRRLVHELVLDYPFTLEADGTVIPRFPALNARLYEAEFGSQLWTVFDAAKRPVVTDDAWEPDTVRLPKGSYLLRFHLRHDRTDALQHLKTLPLALDLELPSALSLDAYADADQALTQGERFQSRTLRRGEHLAFWLATPDPAALASRAAPGDLLIGNLRYESAPGARDYPLLLAVGPAPSAPSSGKPKPATPAADTPPGDPLAEARRDFEISLLDRLNGPGDTEAFQSLAAELVGKYPDALELRTRLLHRLDDSQRHTRACEIAAAADAILDRIDRTALAAHLGTRAGSDPDPDPARSRHLDRQKEVLLDALFRKARAFSGPDGLQPSASASASVPSTAATDDDAESGHAAAWDAEAADRLFEETCVELTRWVDLTQGRYLDLHLHREWKAGRPAVVLRHLNRRLAEAPTDRSLHERRIRVLDHLGWSSWADHERARLHARFPASYPPF